MLRLFHDDRSTACQRVRLALEEKGIAWDSVIVDTARGDVENLPEDYHRLNPKGLVPVIIHDGVAIPVSLASRRARPAGAPSSNGARSPKPRRGSTAPWPSDG